jgi:uncharacterized hydrophobic protein (TIGR00271 family)
MEQMNENMAHTPAEQPTVDPPKEPKGSRTKLFRALSLFLHGRFDLREDSASQEVVMEEVRKGIEFRGTNLWVLVFAVFIASLGLNVNSTAVIIGAMLVSPLMGPIIGIGTALGINDFELLKKAWQNFLLMVVVSLVTSLAYFIISPISTAQSELLARTSPTTYDVLIAFFGGMAGMVAQTRKDKSMTVISGVAIATALMPPLCTAGYGIATGQFTFLVGALYLFTINAVFIALAAYLMVLILKYEKKTVLDPAVQKKNNRYIAIILIVVLVPSVLVASHIVRRTTFEDNADRYVAQVFQFNRTMVVDYSKEFHYDKNISKIEIRLVGEPLSQNVIDNAEAQMADFGLKNTELHIKQTDSEDRRHLDISRLQKGYAEIIDEKNAQIDRLRKRLASLTTADTLSGADISREMAAVIDNIESVSLSKHTAYNDGKAEGESVVAIVRARDNDQPLDIERIKVWLSVRTKSGNVKVIQEQ